MKHTTSATVRGCDRAARSCRWLAILQGNYRGLGDYTRPRVCRTISSDAGRTWSVPEQKFLNHGTSTVTLDGRDGEEIMVGGWKDRGIHFTVGRQRWRRLALSGPGVVVHLVRCGKSRRSRDC